MMDHHNIRKCDRCAPHTYLTIGQDYDSIQDYIRNVVAERRNNNTTSYYDDDDSNDQSIKEEETDVFTNSTTTSIVRMPSIYMFYTDIQELRGLYQPINYGGGIQYANGLLLMMEAPPVTTTTTTVALQIGLWLNGTIGCQNILHGLLQDQIQQLFHYCIIDTTTTTSISKIYLRIGYEFDNPQFGYSDAPSIYRQAFQYIIQECYALYSYSQCRSRIDFVWHTWAASLLPVVVVDVQQEHNNVSPTTDRTRIITLDDYYPGDDYVDWVGISLFSQLYTETTIPPHITQLGTIRHVQYACTFAHDHNKPIMIAESTPFGGIDQLRDPWQDWFVPVLHLIDKYDIRMWSYIYCNWNSIPMWNNTGFGDSRLEQNRTILHLWYQHVLNNSLFSNEYELNDAGCTSNTMTTSFHNHQERSNSLLKTNNMQSPNVSSSLRNEFGSVQGSLSGSFERDTLDTKSISIFYVYSSWTLLVNVLLFLFVKLVQRRAQYQNSTQRGYEALA